VIEVYTLGDFRVVVDGQSIAPEAWRRRRATQLFKCLLSSPNCRLTREVALDQFWPDSDLDKGATNLRSVVHAMRRTLDPGGSVDPIIFDRGMIGLRTGPGLWVDADAFEAALDAERAQPGSIAPLEQASALYRGDYLPDDVYEDWAIARRQHLKYRWFELQHQLARHYEQLAESERALECLRVVMRADSGNERAAQSLMRLLMQLGRTGEAVQVYDALRQVLVGELGLEPAPESLELRRQAGTGDPRLSISRARLFRCAYPFPQPVRLIGRDIDLDIFERSLERGRDTGQVLMLSAPAGTGKSALTGKLVQLAQERGVLCLAGGSYEDRGALPLAPFQEALTDYVLWASTTEDDASLTSAADRLVQIVGRLRQHLGASGPIEIDASTERLQLFGAILSFLRTVAERMPVLLCLEDLHAADAATLNLIHYLARQTRNSHVVVLGTFRSDEVHPGDPLMQLLSGLSRERLLQRVQLEPLNREDTGRLVMLLSEHRTSHAADSAVYGLTDGNPLFVEQLVHSLREQGRLDELSKLRPHIMTPDSRSTLVVRQIFASRLQQLGPPARETLEVGAVLGLSFDYSTLLAVAEPASEPELLGALDEALSAELLRETASGFAFHHSLLREEVYWSLRRTRRMLLHARAAETLENLSGSATADRAAELAYHYAEAGRSAVFRTKAARYGLVAGRQAATLSSYPEALTQYVRVCAILDAQQPITAPSADLLAALVGRGLAERELAMWPECVVTFRRVLALTDDFQGRAEARSVIAYALAQMGDFSAGTSEVAEALAELKGSQISPALRSVRVRMQLELAVGQFLAGKFAEVREIGSQMLTDATELDLAHPLNWAHTALVMGNDGAGFVQTAVQHARLAIEAAQRSGDRVHVAVGHENLGLVYVRGAYFPEARTELRRALTLFRESANDLRAINTLQAIGRVALAEGDIAQAQQFADTASALVMDAQSRWAAQCEELAGGACAMRAEWQQAEVHFSHALELRESARHAAGAIEALVSLAALETDRGTDWQAEKYLVRAVDIARRMDPCPQRIAAWRELGRLHLRRGEMAAASTHIQAAMELAERLPQSVEYAPTLAALAELQLGTQCSELALATAERAMHARMSVANAISLHALLADILLDAGRAEHAGQHANLALELAERTGAPHLLERCRLALARVAD
jgi:DNA-binding SARP family transcriptional activator